MFFDQIKINVDYNDLIKTNEVVNGYFYLIQYEPIMRQTHKVGFDRLPVIYCVEPDDRNINNFWAVNFHYFIPKVQEYIIDRMIKFYQITEGESKRVIIPPKELKSIYTNIQLGYKCYNRTGVRQSYQIKNSAILKYLQVSPEFFIKTQQTVENELNLSNGNKGF